MSRWEPEELAAIGRRIARRRNLRRMSQKELAEAIGVSERTIHNYEAGHTAPFEKLDKLADVLGVDAESLLEGDDELTLSPIAANRIVQEIQRMSDELSTLRALVTGLTAMVENLQPTDPERGKKPGNAGTPSERGPVRTV